jgi:hypothetical protein
MPALAPLNQSVAQAYLSNGSVLQASEAIFTSVIGPWFWVVLIFFTLVVVQIKSEEPGFVAIVAVLTNALLAYRINSWFEPILWTSFVLSLAIILYSIFGNSKYE